MKPKIKFYAISIIIAQLWSANIQADTPNLDLMVKGTIDVPSCTVSVANNGIYDYGKILPTIITSGTGHTDLGKMTKAWSVNCDANTFMTFKVTDNRSESASVSSHDSRTLNTFGLGIVNKTGKLGYYTIKMTNPTVDGEATKLFNTLQTSDTDIYVRHSDIIQGWGSPNSLAIGRNFTADLAVNAYLAGTSIMAGPLTESIDLDGSTTLSFAFGL